MTTPTTSPNSRAQVYKTQDAQHTSIRELVADLLATSTADQVGPLLAEMSTMLTEHFDHEEREDGVFSNLLEVDPTLGGDINAFVDQHQRFVAQLSAVRQVLDSDPSAAVDQAHALGQALAAHEQAENELMFQALYEDVGTHD